MENVEQHRAHDKRLQDMKESAEQWVKAADKRLQDMKESAEKRRQEEKEATEKQRQEEKEAIEKQKQEEKEAADKRLQDVKESAEQWVKAAEKQRQEEKEAAEKRRQEEKEATEKQRQEEKNAMEKQRQEDKEVMGERLQDVKKSAEEWRIAYVKKMVQAMKGQERAEINMKIFQAMMEQERAEINMKIFQEMMEQRQAQMERPREQMEQCREQMEQCRAQMEQRQAQMEKIFQVLSYRTSKKITFTQDVKNDQIKIGNIMLTESYLCDSPVLHKVRGAVKRVKDGYKVTIIPSSDRQNKQIVWPVRLNAKLYVVKDGGRYLKGSLQKSWEKEDWSNVYKDFDWTNSIEVPFADLDNDGISDPTDSSVTFYWDVDVSVSAADGQFETPLTTQVEKLQAKREKWLADMEKMLEAVWDLDYRKPKKITFTQDVETDLMKTGNIMWTESYLCDSPLLHKIRGAVKREEKSYKVTLIPSSDLQNQQLVWPVCLDAKLSVVKNGVECFKGSLKKSWKKEDLSNVYKDFDWTNSIEVPFADLYKNGIIDATDSSVVFKWDVDVSVSAPDCQSQPPTTTQATANSPMESLKIACHRKDEMLAGDRVAKTVSATKKFQYARVKRSASVGCSRDESLGKAKAKKLRSSVEVLQPGQDEQQQFEMVTVLAN